MAKKTAVRGVTALGGGRYRIRVTYIDPKTGKERNRVREVSASSVTEAARMRLELRDRERAARQPRARQRQRTSSSPGDKCHSCRWA